MEYGCIGERLSHSFSKEIHARLADYRYELCELSKDEIHAFMTKKDFKAINVTIPYKQTVIPYLDEIDAPAKKIGAVNTVVNRNGRLYGYNTDFCGMKSLIERAGITVCGKKVLILGSGGTSKTAVAVAEDLGATQILRVSRQGTDDCITYDEARQKHGDADVIINTTPVGMYPNINGAAVDLNDFPNASGVADAVYNPLCSKLVLQARSRDIAAEGGLYMLVMQAAEAIRHFIGKTVEKQRVDDVFNEIYRSKQNLVLTGMPSSGKSTLGKIVARNLGMDFFDSDEEIVKTAQKSIPQIFEESGETAFRDLETRVIEQLSSKQGAVIATGGGAVLRNENINLLRANGVICFLDRPLEQLITTDDRPLSSDRKKLEQRYNERYGIYCKTADFKIDCVQEIDENVRMIEKGFKG